jgi:hypothetical protein
LALVLFSWDCRSFGSVNTGRFDFHGEAKVNRWKEFMNAEQIREEIGKLNWIEKIGIYRWINDEATGDHRIAADRSQQIRLEIERICRFPDQTECQTLNAER